MPYIPSPKGRGFTTQLVIKTNAETSFQEPWPIITFCPDDYLEQLKKEISFGTIDDSNYSFELIIEGERSVIDFTDTLYIENDYIKNTGVCGDIVGFFLDDNGVRAEFRIGAEHDKWAVLDYYGTVYADCSFKDDRFILSNFTFLLDR